MDRDPGDLIQTRREIAEILWERSQSLAQRSDDLRKHSSELIAASAELRERTQRRLPPK